MLAFVVVLVEVVVTLDVVVVTLVVVVDVVCGDLDIAGMLIEAIDHTFPPSLLVSPL